MRGIACAAPACHVKKRLQLSDIFGPRLAKRLHERTLKRTRAAGLRGAKLRPADLFEVDSNRKASPQPSSNGIAEKQARSRADGPATIRSSPPSRGQLRAADVCDVELAAKYLCNNRRLRTAGPDGPKHRRLCPGTERPEMERSKTERKKTPGPAPTGQKRPETRRNDRI